MLLDLKRPEEALASYDRAIALKPDYAEAALQSWQCAAGPEASRGSAGELRQGDRAQARLAEAYSNRGIALRDLKRPEEALASYDKAIALKPDYAEADNNRGTALLDLRRPRKRWRAMPGDPLKPDYAAAHYNRGNALMDLTRPEEALASYDKAIAL